MVTQVLRELLEQAAEWPTEDQLELFEYARTIEARRTGTYLVSDDERAAILEGLAEADAARFVTDEVLVDWERRHRE